MSTKTRRAMRAFPVLFLVVVGCVTVDPDPDYERARTLIQAATGETGLYHPGEDELVSEKVKHLLAGGVSSEEAVRIALLNNRNLQALFREIGVARAEVVQSGLLSNPSFDGLVRFSTNGGGSNVEAGLAQNLIELWHIPARKRLRERELERTVLRVAHSAAQLAAETKGAYFTATASAQSLSVEEDNLGSAREFLELTLARQQAGAATEVDVNAARAEYLDQEVFVRTARLAAFEAKTRLALRLGLTLAPEELMLSESLPALPEWEVDLGHLLKLANEYRLDLRAAQENIHAAGNAVALEKRLFIKNASAGVAYESEGSDLALGPIIGLEIPIFDQNQAQIAKAEFRYEQARKALEALSILASQQVRGAHERFTSILGTARLYQGRILPLQESSLELARESFRAGKTGFLSVLEAQRRLLNARRDSIVWLGRLSLTLPELEAVSGQPLQEVMKGPAEESETEQKSDPKRENEQ